MIPSPDLLTESGKMSAPATVSDCVPLEFAIEQFKALSPDDDDGVGKASAENDSDKIKTADR